MSDVDTQTTATLLPQATVAIYSRDAGTLEAARSIPDDWRFARVTMQIDEGDAIIATQAYEELESPDLIIIQTDTIDDGFVTQLEELAGNCGEGTEAIVIGPDNDVNLYRKLIDMGVSDYLVRPISTEMLAEIIAKTLIEQHGVSGSRLVAFLGAKGGVGTSMVAENCGWASSEVLKQKTLLIDASGGWSVHPVSMGFEPSTTLLEAAKAANNDDEDSIARMLFDASDKYTVLASGADVMLEPAVNDGDIEQIIEMLMVKYPVVLVDTSCASPALKKSILAKANSIVLVTSPTVSCLRLARSLVQEVTDMRGGSAEDVSILVNQQGIAPANELSKADIEKAMEASVDAVIPFDPKLCIRMESEGVCIANEKDAADMLKSSFVPLMRDILKLDAKAGDTASKSSKEGLLSGFLGKIGTKK